ncbi:AAA family ATPase [Mycolicibacterium sp. S2-37]|nr:AAA family ATPase [Mycolicibacterium sp. S2-37]
MRGYSGSGKSTRAAEIAKATDAVVVNRDYLRKMLLNEWWTGRPVDEERVTVAERAQVLALLKADVDVVVDATHLNASYLRKWSKMADKLGVEFEVVDVIEDLAVCRQRDHARMLAGGRYVGDSVIDKQAKSFPVANWPTVTAQVPFEVIPVEPNPDLQPAIIVDIDGTVAHMTGRSPYDYSRVSEDVVDPIIRDLVNHMDNQGYWVLFVSGRDHTCREDTEQWLNDNGIWWDHLFMRPAGAKDERGNKLPDYKVKHDLFNQNIRGKWDVKFVLDDRDQVVELWRKMGLKCLQVQPGDF